MSGFRNLKWWSLAAVVILTAACSEHKTGSTDTGSTGTVKHNSSAEKADPATEKSQSYIVSPEDGEMVSSPFKVVFGLTGMGVAPAGVQKDGTGHHHLLIDVADLPPLDRPLPSTDNIIHFGGGQTETWLTLSPGEHTLQLLPGDFAHIPHTTPLLSKKITITVSDVVQ